MFYRSTPPGRRRNRGAASNRFRRARGRAAWRRPEAASGPNDKGLEALELWKKRALLAFLLVSLCMGAAALLVLEAGVVHRAFVIEFGHCEESRLTTPTAAPDLAEPACSLPIPNVPSDTKDAPGVTPGGGARLLPANPSAPHRQRKCPAHAARRRGSMP